MLGLLCTPAALVTEHPQLEVPSSSHGSGGLLVWDDRRNSYCDGIVSEGLELCETMSSGQSSCEE